MRFPHKAERVTHHKVVAPTKFDMMNYSNNNAGIPVGFRFHPTDEELVGHYLADRVITPPPEDGEDDVRIIRELDLYRFEPWDLSEVCKIPGDHSVNQNNWYFFSHKDKKYPTGNRANRATKAGFWKATGRDKLIQTRAALGMRKTLVFYRGRAPQGQKTDWIMHEFRLGVDGATNANVATAANSLCASSTSQRQRGAHAVAFVDNLPEGAGAWVVCRVFRKTKNLKCRGDADTPSTSLEEDHQMALVPELTDSTEKFSSDEGEHVDYYPQAETSSHIPTHRHLISNNQQERTHQLCKQEMILSVADYPHIDGAMMLAPQATGSMFGVRTSSGDATPTASYANAFQIDASGGDFESNTMGGASSLSASALFANNSFLLSMPDGHHLGRGDMNACTIRHSSSHPGGMLGLDHEDFSRFGQANPSASLLLDQYSLSDVVTRPLEHLSQQLQQSSELLSSAPHHEMVPFGLPWHTSSSRSGLGAGPAPNQLLQPSFVVDFQDSINTSAFLSSGE